MDENELGMNVGYEADYRGKYMPIENAPLINDGSEIGMKEKITAWVARDKNNKLFLFFQKPHKTKYYNVWECTEGCYSDNQEIDDSEIYSQVKWEDKEPTKVELTIKICE